ncbi:MAG: hypothetical protein ACI92O_000308 [Colwellia sp.]|jgi:hypothetical protein
MNPLGIILIVILITSCTGGDFGNDKHVTPGLIIVGSDDCNGGEGFFDGPRECNIKVKWPSGRTEYTISWADNNMIGNTVYRECWTEYGKSMCFKSVTDIPRSMYLEGSGKYTGAL